MPNTQETYEAILQALNNQTVRFEPFRGLHKDIEVLDLKDGSLYFAYDTGSIFLDVKVQENGVEKVKRFKMGGSGSAGSGSSGFVYTNASMNDDTLAKVHSEMDNVDSPGYYIYRKAFNYQLEPTVTRPAGSDVDITIFAPVLKPENEWGPLPEKDTLLLNSNGWLFRVVEQEGQSNRVIANIISTGSSGGSSGGGGGGGSTESGDDLFLAWGSGWRSNGYYVYGQTNELEVTPTSTRDAEVQLHILVEDTISGKVILDTEPSLPSGQPYKFNTGILPLSQKGISITISLDSNSSRMYKNYKPKQTYTGITVFKMDLTKKDPNEFYPLNGLNGSNPTQIIRFIPTGSADIDAASTLAGTDDKQILHVYVDNEEIITENINGNQDGRDNQVSIPGQTHGMHTIKLQLSAVVNNVTLYSNELTYQCAWVEEGSETPIVWIGGYDETIVNYENSYIKYMAYDPLITAGNTKGIQISLYKNGEEVNQISTTYDPTTSEWLSWDITDLYDAPSVATGGKYATTNFSIAVRGVKADVSVVVTNEGSRDLKLRKESSLLANFSAAGRSNDEIAANRGVFRSSVGNAIAQLTGFNWQNNGWGKDGVDANGVDSGAYLTIANGAAVTIPFQGLVLNEVSKPYSFEIRFRIRNIQAYSTLVTTIPYYFYVDGNGTKSTEGQTEDWIKEHHYTISKDADGNLEMDEANSKKEIETENGIVLKWLNDQNMGFVLGTQEAYFNGPNGTANVRYGENEVVNISFIIEPTDKLCYIYLNGILSGAIGLPNPAVTGSAIRMNVPFEINSNYCDFDLYRFRVYQDTLTMPDVIHNYLSDLHSIKLYDENDLARLTDPTELDYDRLVKYNKEHPGNQTMPYAVWTLDNKEDGDKLPYFKGNKKSVTIDFVNPCLDEALDLDVDAGGITEWYYYTHSPSYTVVGAEINVQGTSSQKYPRRNFKTKYKKASSWIFTKGPLKGYPVTKDYFFYKTDNSIPAVQKGKLVTKIESYEETDSNGLTQTKYREIPDNDSATFNSATMVKLVGKFHMDQEAVATNRFTWKIDYMESSGSYNTGFANLMGNQVHPLYEKHPLDDLNIDSTGMRTSVYGYPVLVFQRFKIDSVKAAMNDNYEYKYIGRYNKNLDKSSNEYYGFELKNYHPYIIRPWDEYEDVKQVIKDSEGNPVLDKDGNEQTEKVKKFKAHHERPFINQIAECWELRDNQGTWCSFRYPTEAARNSRFGTLVAGTSGASKELEVIKHFEYRYTQDEDAMDDAYAYKSFTDENGVKREDRDAIVDYLRTKYSNLEKLFDWLDSTDTSSVPETKPNLPGNITAGPWVTANQCTDVGEDSKPQYTYQQVGSSAIFDSNKTYYRSEGGDQGPFIEATGITSLIDYELVIPLTSSSGTPLKGTDSYFTKVDDDYIPVSLAQLTIPSKTENNLINIDGEGKFTLYKFTKTTDTEINEDSVYYEYDYGVYIVVSNPLQENIENYYEASLEETSVFLYKLIHPVFYEKVVKYYLTTFTRDTENYRLAKFRNEFEKHLDKEYCLVYFILTELLLCYDSRGKNMMLASFGPREWIYEVATDVTADNVTDYFVQEGQAYAAATEYDSQTTYYSRKSGDYIWYPIFYDIDTQLGLNNSGAYLWDYDADVTEKNIFSTPNSVLWNNFYTIFYDDIVLKYRALRVNHLDYGPIKDAYECLPSSFDSYAMRGIRPIVAIGLDEYYKYLAPTVTGYYDTTGAFLKLPGFTYAYTCQGDKKLTTELLLQNRLNYLDSQWLGGNYTDKKVLQEIFIRANANQSGTSDTFLDVTQLPEAAERRNFSIKAYEDSNGNFIDNGLDARAGYKIKPYLHQSVTYFVDNQPVAPVRYINQPDGVLTNVSPDVKSAYQKTLDVSQQINYIPAANYISSLGDLSLSYPNSIQIFKGNKLLDLNIGSDHPLYYNSLLNAQSDFSLASLPLLRTANFSKLTNFGRDVSLSDSAKLQEFKALGSTLTRVAFAPGAPLHTVLLPSTVTGLQLIEHQELKDILTEPPVLMTYNNSTSKYEPTDPSTYRGLYIEGVTDIGNRAGIGHTLNNIQIRGGKLEYNSYIILKNLVTLKVGAKTNTDLAIEYYDVHWSPYSIVEAGTPYDDEITYYELTDHSTYKVYTHTSLEEWDSKLINNVIYTYDANAKKETIQNLDLLKFFIEEYRDDYEHNRLNQFYGQTAAQATMPIIAGSIYVDNETPNYQRTEDQVLNPLKPYFMLSGGEFIQVENPSVDNISTYYEDTALIDEAEISTYWNVYYPDLQISAARVIESNITKYVNVLTSGKEEIVDVKRSANTHPVQLTALAPTRTNYDFKGWALDKEGNNMFVNYDYTTDRYENFEGALESYEFTNDNKILTLYAIFRIHNFSVNFYNDDGSFLQTVYNEYSVTPGLKEPPWVPTKSNSSGLDSDKIYTWKGWYRRIAGTVSKVLIDLSKFTPTADYEFIAAYDDTPSDVHDEQNILDKKYLNYELDAAGTGYRIALNPNYYLTGKITLPTQIDNIPVTELGTVAGSFNPAWCANNITHIFWATDNRALKSIKGSCFQGLESLVYYEQPDTCRTLGGSVFANCINLGRTDGDVFYQILEPVTSVGANVFSSVMASRINIPGHSYESLYTGAFGSLGNTYVIQIGREGDPCNWQTMFNENKISASTTIFTGLGANVNNYAGNVYMIIYSVSGNLSNELKNCFGIADSVGVQEFNS